MANKNRFDYQMEEINSKVYEMGTLCAEAIQKTIKCFSTQNKELAQEIIDGDKQIDSLYREIEQRTFRVLLLDHPVASDFRQSGSALKLITDLERIGDYCVDIADEIKEFPDEPYYPSTDTILAMGDCTKSMIDKVMRDFLNHDVEDARTLEKDDDRIDRYFSKTKSDLIDILKNHENQYADQTIIFMMIAKYLERIGDHIVNIGEWIDYSSTGSHLMS